MSLAGLVEKGADNHRPGSVGEIPGAVGLGGASITIAAHVLGGADSCGLILKMLGC